MSVSANYDLRLNVKETQSLGDVIGDDTFTHQTTTSGTLTASSTVPATKAYSDTRAIVADPFVEQLDLTALVGPLASAITFNGLKVQLIKITATATNTGNVTFEDGTATPYNFFAPAAAAGGKVTLAPGMAIEVYGNDKLLDVSAAASDIKVTGTVEGDTYTIELVAG